MEMIWTAAALIWGGSLSIIVACGLLSGVSLRVRASIWGGPADRAPGLPLVASVLGPDHGAVLPA